VSKNYFEFEYIIGKGGFSKVWKVKLKKTGKYYALKEMSKVKIIDKKSEKSIIDERDFLSKLKHPFIINMICAFQDYENLYLLIDYLPGGDLRYHLNSSIKFTEVDLKFFISCLILSLEYIHSNNIIHRDIKPENLVFDEKGYLRLTDFGVAKIIKGENNVDTSGTPGYMAPEVILGKNHSFPVDFFAIGVIGYELLLGRRPYRGKNRKEIKKLMNDKKEILIEPEDNINNKYSNNCINFINQCLKKEVEMRIGFKSGIKELKSHSWFNNFEWDKLYNKNMPTNFIPKDEKNFDQKYCENNDKISNETFERYKDYMKRNDFVRIFEGYTFFNNEVTINTLESEITRESTCAKTNKQENNENSNRNMVLIPKINKNTFNRNNSLNLNLNFNNKEINEKSKFMMEKNVFQKIHEKETSLFNAFMKDQKIKKILIKNEGGNGDVINLNKKYIKDETFNKVTENDSKLDRKNNKIKEFKNEKNNLYLNDIFNVKVVPSPIKLNNNINLVKENNAYNNDINTDIKNQNNDNFTSEINVLNIKKNSNSSINLLENKINIPLINFRNQGKKKLNIHNLSGRETREKISPEIIKENTNDYLLNKKILKNSKIFNNNKKNQSSKNTFVLPDIRHFNFRINNKKKIRYMYLNQNRIIENSSSTNKENKHSRILEKFICKYPLNKDNIYKKLSEETYQTLEMNKIMKVKLIKSQSSVFPLINNFS